MQIVPQRIVIFPSDFKFNQLIYVGYLKYTNMENTKLSIRQY